MMNYIVKMAILAILTSSCGADFNTKSAKVQVLKIKSTLVTKNDYLTQKPPKKTILKSKGEYTLADSNGDTNELTWAKKFNIVELGNLENSQTTYKLLKDNGLLDIPYPIAYDWMPAFYYYTSSTNREFVQWLYDNKETATLNPNGPFVHCENNQYDWCQDYYYNLGNQDVLERRVNDLTSNLQLKGFKGLFFDWAPGAFIDGAEYKAALANFKQLNPNQTYLDTVKNFYKRLQALNLFIVTNQAFRNHQDILPYVTYDMTESYITTTQTIKMNIQLEDKGWVNSIVRTNYYPIYDNSSDINDSLEYINILQSYKNKYKKNGFKNFIYLNYLAPEYEKLYSSSLVYRLKKPKNGIYFSYAMAKLSDNLVYAEVPEQRSLERDDVYLYDLGEVLDTNYEQLKGINSYVRFYQNGFVLVSDAYDKTLYVKIVSSWIKKEKLIYDLYEKKWIKSSQNGTLTIKLNFQKDTFTKKKLPLGRVYLYL